MLGFPLASAPLADTGPLGTLAADELTIYAATEDFETGAGDDPADIIMPGVLLRPLRLERSLLQDLVGGTVAVTYGEAELVNLDRTFDALVRRFDVTGRPAVIRLGAAGRSWADFVTIFDGLAAGWHADEERLVVKLRGWELLLETALEVRTYAGTGGLAGGADLEGKRVPVALGWILNATPALVIALELLYQVHGGWVRRIAMVHVRGRPLAPGADHPDAAALRAATIAPGTFATCHAEGLFRIAYASDGEAGAVTCDVEGAMVDGVFLATTAQVARHILVDRAGVDPVRVADATGAPWQFHAPIGFYAGPDDTDDCADALARLLRGCGGWGGFGRRGVWGWGALRLPDPATPPVAVYDEADLVDVTPMELPAAVTPPPWRWRVAYDRNWTPQASDLAGAVTDERRAWLKESHRLAERPNATTRAFYRKPSDPDPVEGYFRDRADAQRLADELEALWRLPRGLFRAELRDGAWARDLSDVVRLEWPRWGLETGASAVVVATSDDADEGRTELMVLVA